MQNFQQQKSFHRIITWNTKQVLKNQVDEEIKMSHCLQNGWEYGNVGHKQNRQSREGDWICIKCNNLNFSFRKRCNRCKVQTREENEQHIRQAYQYYQDYYQQLNCPEYHEPKTVNPNEPEDYAHLINHPFDPSIVFDEAFEQAFEDINLPSVSPIIKRYNKQKTTPKTQISQGSSSDEQSIDGKEYLQQYCWKNIMIEDQMDSDYSAREGCDYWDLEIEKIVQNIVI